MGPKKDEIAFKILINVFIFFLNKSRVCAKDACSAKNLTRILR